MNRRSNFAFAALLGISAVSLLLPTVAKAEDTSKAHICRIDANDIWGSYIAFNPRKEVIRSEIRPQQNVWLINDRALPIEEVVNENDDGVPTYAVSIREFASAFVLSELARRGTKLPPEGEQVIVAQLMSRYGSTLQGRERYAIMVPGTHTLIFSDREPYTGEADRAVVITCDETE